MNARRTDWTSTEVPILFYDVFVLGPAFYRRRRIISPRAGSLPALEVDFVVHHNRAVWPDEARPPHDPPSIEICCH